MIRNGPGQGGRLYAAREPSALSERGESLGVIAEYHTWLHSWLHSLLLSVKKRAARAAHDEKDAEEKSHIAREIELYIFKNDNDFHIFHILHITLTVVHITSVVLIL
jgi:hypothetical protein